MANKWLSTAALAAGLVAIPSVASAETQLRLFGGISQVNDIEVTYDGYDAEISTDSGFVIGAAYGVVNGNWVFEGELSHRSVDFEDVSYDGYTIPLDGDASATALMANAWYNFPTSSSLGFYAGGGVGMANAEATIEGYSDDGTEFVWQLGGGLNFRSEAGFSYGVGYRYFSLPEIGDSDVDITSHEVVFEFINRF